jgi:hypothetical protein
MSDDRELLSPTINRYRLLSELVEIDIDNTRPDQRVSQRTRGGPTLGVRPHPTIEAWRNWRERSMFSSGQIFMLDAYS